MSDDAPAEKPPEVPGHRWLDGEEYMPDSKGKLTPIKFVRTQDQLQDGVVRSLFAAAQVVAAALREFKVLAFTEIDAFNDILADRYSAPKGGEKGNITLTSYDGLLRMKIQIGDRFEFGPEILAAKALVNKCLDEWSVGANAKIRLIVMDAFDADKEGKLNRGKLLGLMRLDLADELAPDAYDEEWKRAMEALKDSIRVVGTCRYILFHSRPTLQAPWTTLSLDAATA